MYDLYMVLSAILFFTFTYMLIDNKFSRVFYHASFFVFSSYPIFYNTSITMYDFVAYMLLPENLFFTLC